MSEPTVCVSCHVWCVVWQAETIHCRLQLWTQTIRELVGLYRVMCGPVKVMCGTVLALYRVMCGPVKVMCGTVMPINLWCAVWCAVFRHSTHTLAMTLTLTSDPNPIAIPNLYSAFRMLPRMHTLYMPAACTAHCTLIATLAWPIPSSTAPLSLRNA